MIKNKAVLFLISLSVIALPLASYAQTIRLERILSELAKRRSTSYQKLEYIDQHKGSVVKGAGKVRDVLKTPGSDKEALVYIKKPVGSADYEIVLAVDGETAEKIQKGSTVRFEGTFAGMYFETLRLNNVKIIQKKFWIWTF